MRQELVRQAVVAAGGTVAVAYRLGFKSENTIKTWCRTGKVPHYHINQLCELGGNKVDPDQMRAILATAEAV